MSEAMVYRSVRYRLHPKTRRKHNQLAQCVGACRFVWNHFLAKNRQELEWHKAAPSFGMERPKPKVSFFSQAKEFTKLRGELDWLRELPFGAVRQVLKLQEAAFKRAFEHGGFPKFKSKWRGTQSVTFPESSHFKLRGGSLYLRKLGWFAVSRKGGNPYSAFPAVSCVVKRELDRWFAVVVHKVPDGRIDNGAAIGVDMNVGQVADSDGEIHRGPDLARLEARRRRYQRKMARQVKGSNRRGVTKLRLGRVCRKIAEVNKHWRHCVSKTLVSKASTVCVEDLRTKAMTASAKGTLDSPGTNVRQKSGLNRGILSTGWSQLRWMLGYKASKLVAVNPAHTSQTCHVCGVVDKSSRKTQSKFHCVHCGHEANADVNAALNILASGIGAAGRGGCGVGWPVMRQNDAGLAA